MIYINNKEKLEKIKLNKDNFYVIADFDKTITNGHSLSTWGVMANSNQLGDEYAKRRTELYQYYRPIEIDVNISDEEKSEYMSQWWKKHINLFYEYGLKEENIRICLENDGLQYRQGAKEFIRKMYELKIPLIIISAGVGNVIEEFFNIENDYYDNISIVSNFIEFKNGIISGLKGDTIHALNKNVVNLDEHSKEKLENRNNILLLGDGLADLKMISDKDIERAITVGFLDEKIEECLESFNNNFDIVLSNEGTFDEVNKILKIY